MVSRATEQPPPPQDGPEPIAPQLWLKTLIEWMLSGQNTFNIAEAVTVTMTADPQKQKELYDRAANHLIECGKVDPQSIRGWCLEAMKEVYRRLLDVGDYAGAEKTIKEIYTLFY